jgi:glycosyltransferase involved in cell wall biosynthesis
MNTTRPRTLLVLSQVFLPDPASVGQHIGDAAMEMVRRGHRVIVYAANRGYENPSLKYLPRENIGGVEVRRLALSSFGKKRILTRVIGTVIFMVQTFFVALLTPGVDAIFFSTSPPLIGFIASIAAAFRRVPVAYWAMDLNPDQLIAMGKITPRGPAARMLETVNRFILRRAALVVALDRFMAERLKPRANLNGKLAIMPPWPHEQHMEPVDREANPFRQRHGFGGKFVVMYSGNHSPANPLRTLLDAAVQLKDEPGLQFAFIGGGLGKREVEETIKGHGLGNATSLPYQPISELRYSLTAADVHVVSLGDDMVGIVHPCKIYGAMAVGRPILFLGPRPSHVSDLLEGHEMGWHVAHGDVARAVETIRTIVKTPRAKLEAMGRQAQEVLGRGLSQEILCGRFCDELEEKLRLRGI